MIGQIIKWGTIILVIVWGVASMLGLYDVYYDKGGIKNDK